MSALLTGKSSTAPPKLSTPEDDVELKDIKPENGTNVHLPIEEDIMQLARMGEIGAIQKLFQSGRFDARYRDEEAITPLHVGFLSRWLGHKIHLVYGWAKGYPG